MTYVCPKDPGELFVRTLEEARASLQKWARFAHLTTPKGLTPGVAIHSVAQTEKRLNAS